MNASPNPSQVYKIKNLTDSATEPEVHPRIMSMLMAILGGIILIGSLIGWMGLHSWIQRLLIDHYQVQHKAQVAQLSTHHILNVTEATICIIQAVLTSVCGIIIVKSCSHDVMWAANSLSTWYSLILSSYFVYDTYAMYKVHVASREIDFHFLVRVKSFMKRKPLLVAHHAVIALILCPILVYRDGIGDFFVGCFYCVEFSGPFTNMRIILSRFGLKNSKWYTLNGIAMILSFGICRVLLFPYMYVTYGNSYGLHVLDVVRKIPLHCNLGSLLVLLPQIHWLRLMILGAIKLSKGKQISEADEKID